MKNILLANFIILSGLCVSAQDPEYQIELTPFIRWDNYPSFGAPFNSVMTSDIKIKGTSWGVGFNLKRYLKGSWFAKAGIGYYKHSFNDIQEQTRLFGTQKSRGITYLGAPSPFGDATNKYWYNAISATIGIEKLFDIKNRWMIIGGFDVTNYLTFSQRYIIFSNSKYRTSDVHYFGFSANIYAGVQRQLGKVSIRPTIIAPIYANWKQDNVFPSEQDNKSRTKWLKGIGVGVAFIHSLKKI